MNIAIWLLAGVITAWFAFSLLRFNTKLGFPRSLVIGVCGGFLGGAFLGPVIGGTIVNPGDFDPLGLFAAVTTGLACLTVSDMVQKRFGA